MKVVVTKEKEYRHDEYQWVLWKTVSVEPCCVQMARAWDIGFAGFGMIGSNGEVSIEADAPWSAVIDHLYLAHGDWVHDGDGYVDDTSEEWPLRFCPWCGEAVGIQNYSAAEH